jgi:phosphate transport system substrate-binding protein
MKSFFLWTYIRPVLLKTAAIFVIAVMSFGQLTQAANDPQVIQGAGATFPEPLYTRWFNEYEKTHGDVDIVYEGVGSGEGIQRFIAGEVDFGASDAAMNDEEMDQVERGVHLLPATAGMVVLAYNIPHVEDGLKLPRDVYVDIFQGEIWRWDDPRIVAANPQLDLPPKLIQVVGRRDSSGTTYAFTNHLASVDEAWRAGPGVGKVIDWPGGAVTGSGNEGVAHKIKISQGSIGYVEYGFAKRLGLPMAVLQNKAGAYTPPSAESGQAALAEDTQAPSDDLRIFITDPEANNAYPIVSYSWLLLYDHYDDNQTARALKDVLAWGLTEGQAVAEEMGYIPLPDTITLRATQVLEEISSY